MKKIAYTNSSGGVSIVGPAPGARLAFAVTLPNGSRKVSRKARPVDTFYRTWPVVGAVAEWAETENQFIARVMEKDVPADARDVQIIDDSTLPDRSSRDSWRLVNGVVTAKADAA